MLIVDDPRDTMLRRSVEPLAAAYTIAKAHGCRCTLKAPRPPLASRVSHCIAASAGAMTVRKAVSSLGKGRDPTRWGQQPAGAAIPAMETQGVRARHGLEEVDSQTGNRVDLQQP